MRWPARNSGRIRLFSTVCAAVIGAAPVTGGPATQPAGDGPGAAPSDEARLDVRVDGGTIHLNARNARLGRLLKEIVDQTGFVVVSRLPLDRPVTLELNGLPLSEGFRRILRHESFLLYQGSASSGSSHGQAGIPGKLWILSSDPKRGRLDGTLKFGGWEHRPDLAGLREALLSDDAAVRKRAVKALRRVDSESSLPGLAEALGDPEARVRVEAVYGLADIGGEPAAAALTSALTDSSAWVRQEATYALGVAGGETAVRTLARALRDADWDVRETAIDAYADLGGDAALSGLAMALADADASLRLEAVEALRDIGPPAVPALHGAVSDPEQAVTRAAILALGEIGGEEATRALETALADAAPAVRRQAVDALGAIGNGPALELLAGVAAQDEDGSIREAAAAFLPAQ